MNEERFNDWWFNQGGEEIADAMFGKTITNEDLERQPSYPNENAYSEALWEKAKINFVVQ